MGFYLSPGVYSKEKDLSNVVTGIGTSSAGIVGYSTKGKTGAIQLITTASQFLAEYGNPVPGEYFHYSALAYLENGNQLYCLRIHNGALYGGVSVAKTGGTNYSFVAGRSAATYADDSNYPDALLYITGKDQGVWNNKTGIRITNLNITDYTFDIEVYYQDSDGVYQQVETWTVSRKEQTDGYGKQQYLETKINDYSAYIRVADNTDEADTVMPVAQAATLALASGSDGSAVSDSQYVTGWGLYTNPDDVDVRLLIGAGLTSVPGQSAMKTVVEARKDCFAIFDMPYVQLTSSTSMVTWRQSTQNFNSSYCGLYTAWVKIYDQWNDKIVEVPPSGYVASMMAYNDYVAEPWYAPAGFNRGTLNVLSLTNTFTQGDRDVLYPAQINALQTFKGKGIAIWGQKTLATKASALDRINVRRLLIVLEKTMAVSLLDYAFEPNNDITRYRITAMLTSYLDRLSARGAFQTETGDRGYRVVCDTTNNTPAVIDANELHVDVFVKPIKAAEFIQVQTIVTNTGASFDELIAKGVMF
jgi:hypothetical protein